MAVQRSSFSNGPRCGSAASGSGIAANAASRGRHEGAPQPRGTRAASRCPVTARARRPRGAARSVCRCLSLFTFQNCTVTFSKGPRASGKEHTGENQILNDPRIRLLVCAVWVAAPSGSSGLQLPTCRAR